MTGPRNADTGAGAPAPTTEHWELRLYVTGRSPNSVRAIENLQLACEQHLAGQYHIEIVDLLENPRLAADDQILAVPTLVHRAAAAHQENRRRPLRHRPAPRRIAAPAAKGRAGVTGIAGRSG